MASPQPPLRWQGLPPLPPHERRTQQTQWEKEVRRRGLPRSARQLASQALDLLPKRWCAHVYEAAQAFWQPRADEWHTIYGWEELPKFAILAAWETAQANTVGDPCKACRRRLRWLSRLHIR